MARTLIVPPQIVTRLREGANLRLAHAAYEIASSVLAVDKEVSPLEDRRDMDRLWALLDALG